MAKTNTKQTETYQMIESLIINADEGDRFSGLRQREASLYQRIAWDNGRGIRIEPEHTDNRTYCAVVVF
jgi:hypothetical protein